MKKLQLDSGVVQVEIDKKAPSDEKFNILGEILNKQIPLKSFFRSRHIVYQILS